MPVLSESIDKFLRRAELTEEEMELLRTDIGALKADAAAVIAILEGATLPVQSVGLANTGAAAIDPGDSPRALGLNSANQLVLHTGDDNGDDLAHLISSNQIIQISGTILGTSMQSQDNFAVAIGRIRLTAAQAVVGTRISIGGSFAATYSNSNRPDLALQLVIHPEETVIDDFGSEGVYTQLGIPTTKELLCFTTELALSAGTTGKFLISALNNHGGFHLKDSSGTATTAVFAFTSTGSIGTVGIDQDILISVYASDGSGTVSAMILSGALTANIYTP